MAFLDSQPVTYNPVLTYSLTNGSPGLPQVKLSPKDLSGAVIDLTGYTFAEMNVANPKPTNPTLAANQTFTVIAADASGITISLVTADAATLAAAMTNLSGKHDIVVGDGTDTLIAALGQFSLVVQN